MTDPSHDSSTQGRLTPGPALALLVAAAVTLRASFACHKGLVLDEFHSLFHASAGSSASFFEQLYRDNHPPLAFACIAACAKFLGDAEWVLRLPALVASALELLLVAALARRSAVRGAGLCAAGLLASSSLHLDFSSQARMYALLSLAVVATLALLLRLFETPDGRSTRDTGVLLGLVLAAGAHTHYAFLHYGLQLALGCAVAVYLIPDWRPRARRLVLPAVVAALLCLPWYSLGFSRQLQSGLPPGGDDVGLAGLAEAMVHLFFLNVRLGGPELRLAFIGAGVLAFFLGLVGITRLWFVRPGAGRALPIFLLLVGYGAPLQMWGVASLWPRSGFTWHYILPSAAALGVACACSIGPGPWARTRRTAVGAVLALALLLSFLNVRSPGSEDYPGAVRAILAQSEPGDLVIGVEWQPAVFSQGAPWDYYAPRLADADVPERAPLANYKLPNPKMLEDVERVHLLRTSLPEGAALMRQLNARFQEAARSEHGFGIYVHHFERRP